MSPLDHWFRSPKWVRPGVWQLFDYNWQSNPTIEPKDCRYINGMLMRVTTSQQAWQSRSMEEKRVQVFITSWKEEEEKERNKLPLFLAVKVPRLVPRQQSGSGRKGFSRQFLPDFQGDWTLGSSAFVSGSVVRFLLPIRDRRKSARHLSSVREWQDGNITLGVVRFTPL